MEPAYLSAFSALAGSVIGGLTSLTASWLTQRVQASAQQRAHDMGVREDLYREFIDEASKSYADALERTEVDAANVVRLYALVSRMRVLSSQRVVDQANNVMQLIMETYRGPVRTLREEAERMKTGGLDPLLGFSAACREELLPHDRRRWRTPGTRA
jgi:hypothetical protein